MEMFMAISLFMPSWHWNIIQWQEAKTVSICMCNTSSRGWIVWFTVLELRKAIKREIEPMILGMCIQTPRIQQFVLFSLWLSTSSLILISWPPIPSYLRVIISIKFLKIFHKIININIEDFQSLGVEKGMVGYLTVSKGAIKIVASGCTVSSPMASICLRDCWSMGPIKYQYIHYEKVGDKFVGRSVTSIYLLTTEFRVSPVYWDSTDSPFGSKY